MEPLYNPDGVEERWQQTWESEGLYNAEADDPRESFTIAHPPPNVTGDLHLGHALQLSLADTLVRTRRMRDREALAWIVRLGVVEAFGLPRLLPALLDAVRVVQRLHAANRTAENYELRAGVGRGLAADMFPIAAV